MSDEHEDMQKILRQLEANRRAMEHAAASVRGLPDTLESIVDDVIFDRVKSFGKDIGEGMSQGMTAYKQSFNELTAAVMKINRISMRLMWLQLALVMVSVVLCLLSMQTYFSMDLTHSSLIKIPRLVMPAPAPAPVAASSAQGSH